MTTLAARVRPGPLCRFETSPASKRHDRKPEGKVSSSGRFVRDLRPFGTSLHRPLFGRSHRQSGTRRQRLHAGPTGKHSALDVPPVPAAVLDPSLAEVRRSTPDRCVHYILPAPARKRFPPGVQGGRCARYAWRPASARWHRQLGLHGQRLATQPVGASTAKNHGKGRRARSACTLFLDCCRWGPEFDRPCAIRRRLSEPGA